MSFVWITICVLVIWLLVTTWLIVSIFGSLKSLTKSLKLTDLVNLEKRMEKRIGFWNLYKFNPFENTGGEQSFVLTLLNSHKDGVVLTILNGRGMTRFYAKKIEGGTSAQQLSAEERQSIQQAINNHE